MYRPFRFTTYVALLFFCLALPLAFFEGHYGRVDYSTDAIPYLDMARALHQGAWKLDLNPLWGLGYPLLIAAVETVFPSTASGEWAAVHALNLVIFAACYAGFFFLLSEIIRSCRGVHIDANNPSLPAKTSPTQNSPTWSRNLLFAAVALFLGTELCIDLVSRVGPDLLVSTLLLLSVALLLRLLRRPAFGTVTLLGITLGWGYIVKTIFLPLTCMVLAIAAVALWRRREKIMVLAPAVLCAALFAIPYAAGLSWAFGHFTMGESGAINYAWHVDKLTQIHWQGGPARFGQPLHPTKELMQDPPVYQFGQPFPVSYPPFFNPPYFYDGYHRIYSLRLQLRAIAANLMHLVQSLRSLPIFYGVLVSLIAIYFLCRDRQLWLRNTLHLWPAWLLACLGILLYVQVHLEARYLPGFFLLLAAIPLTTFLARSQKKNPALSLAVVAILCVTSLATLAVTGRNTISNARHHRTYLRSPQWDLATYLSQHGLQPGDAVAAITGSVNANCTWAHVDGLRVVAELTPGLYASGDTGIHMFWDAPAATRNRILQLFQQAGARAVIARDLPGTGNQDGWQPVPNSGDSVYFFSPDVVSATYQAPLPSR